MANGQPMTYYVGQKPAENLLLTVRDELKALRTLAAYSSVEMFFSGPDGLPRTHTGTATITSAPNGNITFVWPVDSSMFNLVGTYYFQVKLNKSNGTYDITNPVSFRVTERIGM